MAKATTAILLAAGEGKRMVSKKQKVMHNLCGRPMLGWVMRSVQQHITERPIVVLGFDGESVKDYFGKDCTYAYQQNVPGNRVDALRAGMSAVNADTGYVLVMAGNMPLITDRTVAALVEAAKGFSASRLICFSDDEDTLISPAYCFEISVLRECLRILSSPTCVGLRYRHPFAP